MIIMMMMMMMVVVVMMIFKKRMDDDDYDDDDDDYGSDEYDDDTANASMNMFSMQAIIFRRHDPSFALKRPRRTAQCTHALQRPLGKAQAPWSRLAACVLKQGTQIELTGGAKGLQAVPATKD